MLCLIFAGFSMGISAQTHLDALIKKCEKLESTDMEVIKNKQKTEKDVETKTVRIRITNDKKLVNEFLDAFKKDASDAKQAMFRKKETSGEVNYFQCRFSKQTYTITVNESENATVTVGNSAKYQFQQFSPDPLQPDQQKQMFKQQQERTKQQQEKIKQHQERMKQHQKRIEQHKDRMQQHLNRMQQYKLKNLDSIILKHNIIADSLILKSTDRLHSINWDSITSKFGKDIDSMVNKLDIRWDEVLEKYELEQP